MHRTSWASFGTPENDEVMFIGAPRPGKAILFNQKSCCDTNTITISQVVIFNKIDKWKY